ncbi:MAG: cation diffusion facilitator family transporter [Dehalococcoidia bacterium]
MTQSLDRIDTGGVIWSRRRRRLTFVLILNLAVVVGEGTGGMLSGSLGLLADAAHNLTDVIGVAAALLAVIWTRRPPDEQRTYGYHRGTVLAAQANAALMLAATALIFYEGSRRLMHPPSVDGPAVVIVGVVALAANSFSAVLLWEREEDLNMRAALLHMAADAGASLGVVLGGALIFVTGLTRVDPVVSVSIALVIGWQAWKMLWSTGEVLLESTPKGVKVHELSRAIEAVEGIDAVHDLHVWSLSSDVNALSAHLILAGHPTLEQAQETGTRAKAAISTPFRIAHATFELECEGCIDDGSWCVIGRPSGNTHSTPRPAQGCPQGDA